MKIESKVGLVILTSVFIWGGIFTTTINGCAGNPSKTNAVIGDTGKVIQCVLDRGGESPEQIAVECAGVTLVDVIAILSVKKRIEMKGGTSKDAGIGDGSAE